MSCDCKKCVSAPQSGHCKECVISFETHNIAQSASTMFYQDRMPLQIRLSVKFLNFEISLSSLVRQSAGTAYPLFESIICRISDSASRLAEPQLFQGSAISPVCNRLFLSYHQQRSPR